MRAFASLLITPCLFTWSGCSSNNLSYQYNENGCDTGKQEFSDQDAYCAGLKDDSRNSGCARDLRRQEFQSRSCGGQFDPPADPVLEPGPDRERAPEPAAPPAGRPAPDPNVGRKLLECAADPLTMTHPWKGLEKGFTLEVTEMVNDPAFPVSRRCHLALTPTEGEAILSEDGMCEDRSLMTMFVFPTLHQGARKLDQVDADLNLDRGETRLLGNSLELRSRSNDVVFEAKLNCRSDAGYHVNN